MKNKSRIQIIICLTLILSLTINLYDSEATVSEPIQVHMSDAYSGHAIIMSGVDFNSSGGYYSIMDPNYTNYNNRSVLFNANAVSSGASFIYNDPGGVIYNNWTASYY